MIEVDGSSGEGGGQILRSSLALSTVLGKPVTITNIRARRKKPGLMRQHLTAVHAAAASCNAEVHGAELGSSKVTFMPGQPAAGDYHFQVGTAGSTTLVLQTILPGLLAAGAPSTIVVEGGTHNPFAPPLDFLIKAYLPLLRRMGARVELEVDRLGFYPAGGGRLTAVIHGLEHWRGFELFERGAVNDQYVRAVVSNLPLSIAQRECRTIASETGWPPRCFCEEQVREAKGPGNVVFIELQCESVTEVFTGFGRKGVPAESVAREVWNEARHYLEAHVPVGPYLADQLMLPLGIAAEQGVSGGFRTMRLSQHSETNLRVLEQFLERTDIRVSQDEGGHSTLEFIPRA